MCTRFWCTRLWIHVSILDSKHHSRINIVYICLHGPHKWKSKSLLFIYCQKDHLNSKSTSPIRAGIKSRFSRSLCAKYFSSYLESQQLEEKQIFHWGVNLSRLVVTKNACPAQTQSNLYERTRWSTSTYSWLLELQLSEGQGPLVLNFWLARATMCCPQMTRCILYEIGALIFLTSQVRRFGPKDNPTSFMLNAKVTPNHPKEVFDRFLIVNKYSSHAQAL